jgi:hypothetical protein
MEPLEDRRLLDAAGHSIELIETSPALFVESQGQWDDGAAGSFFHGSDASVSAGDGELEGYAAAAAEPSFGPPEALNTNAGSDTGSDWAPQVTTDGTGNWVAVWASYDSLGETIGTDSDILVSRSADAGATWTAPVPLNTNAGSDSGHDLYPQVTTDGEGAWVAVWRSNDSLGGTIGTDYDILVSRSADAGATWTAPAALSTNASSDSRSDDNPQVTTDRAGNWVAVWHSESGGGWPTRIDYDILVSRSADAGSTWTTPAILNTTPVSYLGNDYHPQVTTDGAGNWVVVWESNHSLGGTIGTDYDILVSRSADAGATWTTQARLNANAGSDSGYDYWPQVTTDGAGNWVAVWESNDSLNGTIGTDSDILVSRSTNAGVTWTAPAPLNTNAGSDAGGDYSPQVTTDGAGRWIAVWHSTDSQGGTIGTDTDILISHSADAGITWTAPVPLNTNAASDSGGDDLPQVTTDGEGNWVAAWYSYNSLGGTIGTDSDILFATFSEILRDYGDAPAPYPTLLADIGAGHAPTGPVLGAYRDAEADGRPDTNALGDDATGTPDDEDGVILPRLTASTAAATTSSLDIDLQNADPVANYLDAWIDFNQDGDWDDLGERIFNGHSLGTTNGTQTLDFTVPRVTGGNIVYGTTYARFRLGTAGGLLPTGLADDGEVEDYAVAVTETWFGPPEVLNTNAPSDWGKDRDAQVTTDGEGNWVAVWRSNDSLGGTIGIDQDIFVSHSTDAGGTWTDPAPLNTNADSDSGDDDSPQVSTDGEGNWVAVWSSADSLGETIGTDLDILVSRSADAGVTWTAPVPVNTNADSDSGDDDSPQVTTDGWGNWVAVWRSADSLGGTIGTDGDILVSHSADAGLTWTAPAPVNNNADSDSGNDDRAQVTTDRAGNWIAVWISDDSLGGTVGTDYDILVSRSADTGVTWTTPVPLNTNADSDAAYDYAPQVTTDEVGVWVSVWYSNDSLGGTIGTDDDILVSRSVDAGATWTPPAPLNTNAGLDSRRDSSPQVTTGALGTWFAVWFSQDSLGGTIGTDWDILVSRSGDAGGTWTAPVPLNTNAGSDSGTDWYPQVTTDGAGHWVAAWYSSDSLGGTIGTDDDILFATFSEIVPKVVGRHVFYDNSKWDGNTPGVNSTGGPSGDGDTGAIAPDKSALLPDQTATFANYTSYPRGINGIMVDVQGLANPAGVGDGDLSEFDFRYGNDDTPGAWSSAPAPLEVDVRDIGGGVHRVTFVWADRAIPNKNWLQVTFKAHPATGLAADDVFYFGNTVGETNGDFRIDYVDAFDVIWPLLGTPLPVGPDHVADINRDGRIDYSDVFDDLWPNLSGPAPLKPIHPPALPVAPLQSTDSVFREDLPWGIELMWFDQLYGGSGDSEEDDPLQATAVDGVFTLYDEP